MKIPTILACIVVISAYKGAIAAPGLDSLLSMNKIFNYQGSLPLKDDRTGEIIKSEKNETVNPINPPPETTIALTEAEAACWRLINEQSEVTFALQNRVLDELMFDLKRVKIDDKLKEAIEKITKRMRLNMNEAKDALKRDAADEFFDALFDSSEDIVHLSVFLRDTSLDEDIFLMLVRAVSRLSRNNSALIQEFTEMCSFMNRSPRPRLST